MSSFSSNNWRFLYRSLESQDKKLEYTVCTVCSRVKSIFYIMDSTFLEEIPAGIYLLGYIFHDAGMMF